MASPFVARRGIDILADIMQCMDPAASRTLLQNLAKSVPAVAGELRKRLFTFDDLAHGDARGLQRLLKLTTLRDLALALKGASEAVLQALAANMSQRAIEDLRDEITHLGPRRVSEIEEARHRILLTARQLVEKRELFIQRGRPDERLVD
ncbi:MAG: Flagellar motor switch protein FliG [Candidatus Ozemobacter sibiricus]|uniref:Flagellar motor switch protein FliG n=1 Tax=Candidatus Ozemobacter sibiricus TaxID=2268124 RepID=A0A367ZMW3_9BACT|nr:MAG: Flagellar motor switch protein FliG [Candidatus Ozemobacter sibiricus]